MNLGNKTIIKNLHKQSVKAILDAVILAELKHENLSGYDIIASIHERFGVLISSGTVYSHLYSLERTGIIEGAQDSKKRVYKLTEKGINSLDKIIEGNIELISKLNNLLKE